MIEDRRVVIWYMSMVIWYLWGSKRQKTVALSTAEAEYMAISAALEEIKWLETISSRNRRNGGRAGRFAYTDNWAAKLISQSEMGSKTDEAYRYSSSFY